MGRVMGGKRGRVKGGRVIGRKIGEGGLRVGK